MINHVVSSPKANPMCLDIKDFYLNTNMSRPEYIRIPIWAIPKDIWELYNLDQFDTSNGYVYVRADKTIYGLPQAGRLASDELLPHLAKWGYHQMPHTHGLFYHETRKTYFSLVVDDFFVSYETEVDAQHLHDCIKSKYKCSIDRKAEMYCGLKIDWNLDCPYAERYADISMPGYVAKALQRFEHIMPTKPQHAPHPWTPPDYGAKVQYAPEEDHSPEIDPSQKTTLQKVVGKFLYYSRAVDSIACSQHLAP